MLEWEDFLAQLRRLNSVALRVDTGETLVDNVCAEKLSQHGGRQADMVETQVVEEISVNWIASSNPKVSRLGIDLLNEAVNNLGAKFKPIMTKVSDQLINKFGNERTQDAALQMFINIFVVAYGGPDPAVYERLLNQSWTDRSWRVREGGCHLLRHTLEQTVDNGHFNGQANQVGLSKLMNKLIKLAAEDKQTEVRESAMDALQRGYLCFGERLRQDIVKRRPSRLQTILRRLDEVETSEEQLQTNATQFKTPSRPHSRQEQQRPQSSYKSSTLGRRRNNPTEYRGGGDNLSAGAMGTLELEQEYEQNVPDMNTFDVGSTHHRIEQIQQRLTSTKTEWEDRNVELRLIRALALEQLLPSGAEFRKFAPAFTQALSDLRSQVTREACVTLGLLARDLDVASFGPMANLGVIDQLIKLVPNSAKIMSSSASACLSIILRECHYAKFPPHFTEQLMISRSVAIRRICIELLSLILLHWDGNVIWRSNDEIVKALTKTLQDADSDVRKIAREAFLNYQSKFPDESNEIRQKLPANVKKVLNSAPMSRSNSNESLASTKSDGGGVPRHRAKTKVQHIPRAPGSGLKMPMVPRAPSSTRATRAPVVSALPKRPGFGRSHSDMDPSATKKFGVFGGNTGFTTPKKYNNIESRYSQKNIGTGTPKTPTRFKTGYSQPGSRSSSPPSAQKQRRTPTSRIPRSRPESANASREASPEDYARHNRRILPTGPVGQRMLSDALLLGMEQIRPSEAISMLCAARTTAEKKDALNQIGKMADQQQKLSMSDQRKITECIQKIIYNGKENILIPTFKVIPKILKTYANEQPMKDWLYGLLTGILKRLGQLLGANREAALEVLESIRCEYPKELQYARVTKFLLDQTASPTNGQKAAILRFLRDLSPHLEGSTIQNSAETRLVISRLVGWCNDQKSPEVRQEASAAIRALFALNPGQFAAALQELPKPFQEGANRALRETDRDTYGASGVIDHGRNESPELNKYPRSQSSMAGYSSGSSFLSQSSNSMTTTMQERKPSLKVPNSCDLTPVSTEDSSVKSEFESVTEKMNSLILNNMNFSLTNELDDDEEFVRNEKTILLEELSSMDTGILEPIADTANRPVSSLLLDAIKLFQRNDHESGVKTVRDAIKEPSQATEWEKHWPRVYPVLLEIACDGAKNDETRLMSLHCLRDAVDVKPELMVNNAEDIIEKYLQIMATDHDDRSNRNVSRSSQNAAMALLRNMSIWASLSILANHVSEPVPVGRDAIDLCRLLVEDKKQIMATDSLTSQSAQNSIHQLMPRLLRQWTSESAAVRKAVVYVLVTVYTTRREMVEPYLSTASQTNRRLFDLYLKKAQQR